MGDINVTGNPFALGGCSAPTPHQTFRVFQLEHPLHQKRPEAARLLEAPPRGHSATTQEPGLKSTVALSRVQVSCMACQDRLVLATPSLSCMAR